MASVLTKKQKKRDKLSLSDLKAIGSQLLSSRSHINDLPLLLSFVSPCSPLEQALEALLSLQAFFTPLLPLLPPSFSSSAIPANSFAQDDPDLIYRTWLRAKFDDLISSLIDICISHQSDEALREVALDTLMEFVKVGNGGRFHSAIYHRLMQNIVYSSMEVEVLFNFLATKYFKYIDVRYFGYISVEKLARTLETKEISDGDHNTHSRASLDLSIRKMYHILSHISPLEGIDGKDDYEMWNGLGVFVKEADHKEQPGHIKGTYDFQKAESTSKNVLSAVAIGKKLKAKFTKAWVSFLRLPFPLDVYKEVLVTLQKAVIPRLSNPMLLCDFLTRSYDIGGVISVMALSSLYVLMTQHGIEYPNFYEKLYGLLLPSIFMAKHRAKFFELLDSCLKSPLLPAYLAAAFAKKLSRLSLLVPPSGALVIIALIHNLLRRHPSINFLVHQESADGATKDDDGEDGITSNEPGIDCFNNDESNPIKTKATRSSLWEIDTLRHHYCPPVSRFVLSLENDLTVKSKTTELAVNDFSSGSYATVFREEIGRRIKQVPLAFYKATPGSLFCESDFVGWTFNHELTTCSDGCWSVDGSEGRDAKRQKIKCS